MEVEQEKEFRLVSIFVRSRHVRHRNLCSSFVESA